MSVKQQFADYGVEVSRFEYDDQVVLAADLGFGGDASAEVVDETVIVLADGEQYDIDVPAGAQVFINNGVLTIGVS